MREYSSNSKIKTVKLMSVLLMATFLQVGTAHSEGGLGGALGSVGNTVGGVTGAVGNTLGGVTGAVGNTVNGVTGTVNNTTASLGVLDSNGALSLNAKSKILKGIRAKARVLSPKELAKLCLSVGGGSSGCGSGNRPKILGLIDLKLKLLSGKQLVGLCVSVGGGCGGSSVTDGGGSGGGGNGLGGMSRGELVAYKKRCVNVLSSPQSYESDIVSICRLIKRQKV